MNKHRSQMMKQRWTDPVFRAKQSAAAKARWADPEYRKRCTNSISEAVRDAQRNYSRQAAGHLNGSIGERRALTVYLDADDFAAVRERAVKERRPVSEIIRTYVQWGLEAEGAEA